MGKFGSPQEMKIKPKNNQLLGEKKTMQDYRIFDQDDREIGDVTFTNKPEIDHVFRGKIYKITKLEHPNSQNNSWGKVWVEPNSEKYYDQPFH